MLVVVFSGYPLGAISDDSYDAGYRAGQRDGENRGYDDGLDEAKRRLNNDQYRRSPNRYEKGLRFFQFLEKKDREYWEKQKNK